MSFRNSIPEKALESPSTSAFVEVLDELQNFKSEVIHEALRVDNFGLTMNRKWIIKKLSEYGVTDIPANYPTNILRQYLLNVDTLFGLRGSREGIELYCSLLSLGKVSIQSFKPAGKSKIILLDSPIQGTLITDSDNTEYNICIDSDGINTKGILLVTIESIYFKTNSETSRMIKDYISKTIKDFLPFGISGISLMTISADAPYYHELLNKNFI